MHLIKPNNLNLNLRAILFHILSVILIYSCKKNDKLPVAVDYKGSFSILEEIADTLLATDTAYVSQRITFVASKEFKTFNWIVGNPLNSFSSRSFTLNFSQSDDIDVKLNGVLNNNRDTSISRHLTIYDRKNHVSPLVGRYVGYNKDNPNDTFSVSIKYFQGDRYPWGADGAYSIENLPKGYLDSTQTFNGYRRPEILGIIAYTGYKNMAIDKSGFVPAQGIKGYASLHRGTPDSLIINYSLVDFKKFDATRTITYIQKQFIGIKK